MNRKEYTLPPNVSIGVQVKATWDRNSNSAIDIRSLVTDLLTGELSVENSQPRDIMDRFNNLLVDMLDVIVDEAFNSGRDFERRYDAKVLGKLDSANR